MVCTGELILGLAGALADCRHINRRDNLAAACLAIGISDSIIEAGWNLVEGALHMFLLRQSVSVFSPRLSLAIVAIRWKADAGKNSENQTSAACSHDGWRTDKLGTAACSVRRQQPEGLRVSLLANLDDVLALLTRARGNVDAYAIALNKAQIS